MRAEVDVFPYDVTVQTESDDVVFERSRLLVFGGRAWVIAQDGTVHRAVDGAGTPVRQGSTFTVDIAADGTTESWTGRKTPNPGCGCRGANSARVARQLLAAL